MVTLELLLTKIPIKTEKQALKILDICSKKQSINAEGEICKVKAKKSFTEERYGNALEWTIRYQDTFYITFIADYLLKHFVQTGDILCPDVIANMGARMFISPRLVFLAKYFDFYQFYRKNDFLPAAELLLNLLESEIIPEYFWPSLLVDTIPLLESKDPKILFNENCCTYLESNLMPLVQKQKKHMEKPPNEVINNLKHCCLDNVGQIINLVPLACARKAPYLDIIDFLIILEINDNFLDNC